MNLAVKRKNSHDKPVFLGRPLLHLHLSALVDPKTTIMYLKTKLTQNNAMITKPYHQLGAQTVV